MGALHGSNTRTGNNMNVPYATPINNSGVAANSGGGGAPTSDQEPAEVFRKRAIAVLTEKLQKSLSHYNEKAVEELDTMFEKHNVLRDRQHMFDKVEKDLQRERDGLEEVLQLLQVRLCHALRNRSLLI